MSIPREKNRTYGTLGLALLTLGFNQCAGTKKYITPSEAQRIVIQYLDNQNPEDTACCDRRTLKSEKTGNRYLFTMKGCKCPCSILIEMNDKKGYTVRKVTCD